MDIVLDLKKTKLYRIVYQAIDLIKFNANVKNLEIIVDIKNQNLYKLPKHFQRFLTVRNLE